MFDAVLSCALMFCTFITNTLVMSLNLSYFVGQLIVWVLLQSAFTIRTIGSLIKSLLIVLYEDCNVFVADVAFKVSVFYEALVNLIENAGGALKFFSNCCICGIESLSEVCYGVAFSLNNLFFLLVYAVQSGCIVLKDAIILMGSTSWQIFTFIPKSIGLFKQLVVSVLIFLLKEIRSVIFKFQFYICHSFYALLSFITDIPKESFYGLCLSICFVWLLMKYWHSIYPSSIRYLGCAIHQSQRALLIVWNSIETFTLWLVTNQRNTGLQNMDNDEAAVQNTNQHYEHGDQSASGSTFIVNRNLPQKQVLEMGVKASQEQEDRLCVVCQDVERNMIILPCRHVCLCHECCLAIRRSQGRCPVCRHVVRRTMRVYM